MADTGFSKERFFELAKEAATTYVTASKRTAKDKLYTTLEDFNRADPKKKRVGESTGAAVSRRC